MYTIGFTNKMYTLWNVYEREEYGYAGQSYTRVFNDYVQNLSLYLEIAKTKAFDITGTEAAIDLSLKGSGSFSFLRSDDIKIVIPFDQFPYGKLMSHSITESTDVYQLNRLYHDNYANPRSRVIARQKLVELGELIRVENTLYTPEISRYLSPFNYAAYKKEHELKQAKNGHFFNNGEKVTLTIKEVGSFSFSTDFGTTWVVNYIDYENRRFKYMGSTPKTSDVQGWINIKATIKHDNYNGVDETKLQRIKIIK